MMLLGDKKKKVATIIAKIKDSGNKPDFVQKIGESSAKEVEMDKPEYDDSMALEGAAEDIISAIKKGDAKALNVALKAHYDLCEMAEEQAEDAEEME